MPIDPDPTPTGPRPRGSRWGRRRRSSESGLPWLPIVIVGAVLVAFAWWWFGWRVGSEGGDPQAVTPTAPAPADTTALDADAVEPLDLPPLAESDGVVREVVGALSRHPRWAAWLVTDELAQRFVSSVANIAAGMSPTAQLPFMAPEGEFRVATQGEAQVVDPASYRRYDVIVDAFVSFDTRGAVRLYRQLLPLFDEAHRTLGFPAGSFGTTLATAIDNVLAVPVPAQAPRVELDVKTYLFVDPALEALTPAEKHVLRLGPENARQVQSKLRDLRDGLVAAGAIPRQ